MAETIGLTNHNGGITIQTGRCNSNAPQRLLERVAVDLRLQTGIAEKHECGPRSRLPTLIDATPGGTDGLAQFIASEEGLVKSQAESGRSGRWHLVQRPDDSLSPATKERFSQHLD